MLTVWTDQIRQKKKNLVSFLYVCGANQLLPSSSLHSEQYIIMTYHCPSVLWNTKMCFGTIYSVSSSHFFPFQVSSKHSKSFSRDEIDVNKWGKNNYCFLLGAECKHNWIFRWGQRDNLSQRQMVQEKPQVLLCLWTDPQLQSNIKSQCSGYSRMRNLRVIFHQKVFVILEALQRWK